MNEFLVMMRVQTFEDADVKEGGENRQNDGDDQEVPKREPSTERLRHTS
jgi:hypothetical protein